MLKGMKGDDGKMNNFVHSYKQTSRTKSISDPFLNTEMHKSRVTRKDIELPNTRKLVEKKIQRRKPKKYWITSFPPMFHCLCSCLVYFAVGTAHSYIGMALEQRSLPRSNFLNVMAVKKNHFYCTIIMPRCSDLICDVWYRRIIFSSRQSFFSILFAIPQKLALLHYKVDHSK